MLPAAAEEIDHFRKVARVAGDIGVDVSFVLSQANEKRFVETFRGLITTWEDNAVFGFLIDRVGRYQLEEFMTAVICHSSAFCPIS
jgi:1,2-phenylacetyl-CoA epoxidase catalytic subunit